MTHDVSPCVCGRCRECVMNRAAYAPYRHQSVGQKPEDVDVEMVRAGLVWQPEVVSGPKLAALDRIASRLRTAEAESTQLAKALADVKGLMDAGLEREDALHAENARLNVDVDVLFSRLKADRAVLEGETDE